MKKKLPYSKQLSFQNEIRIFWGNKEAWLLAKNRREHGDPSCLVLPASEPLSNFDFSNLTNKNVLVCVCFYASATNEKALAMKLLSNGVKSGVFLRFKPSPGRYQLFGNVRELNKEVPA